ncbi:hypothetical protein CSA37_07985 [Candidatus Fermentibacteria bacterium]|nr:MAG: hypothetical protein CSA37_07985 [Candidatus Fermentibacteria bacterium]
MISGNIKVSPLDRMALMITAAALITAAATPLIPDIPIYTFFIIPAVLLVTALFTVRGYTIPDGTLTVHRPL